MLYTTVQEEKCFRYTEGGKKSVVPTHDFQLGAAGLKTRYFTKFRASKRY